MSFLRFKQSLPSKILPADMIYWTKLQMKLKGGLAMSLSASEQKVLQEIRNWENKLYKYEANDFQLMYDKYIERSFSNCLKT